MSSKWYSRNDKQTVCYQNICFDVYMYQKFLIFFYFQVQRLSCAVPFTLPHSTTCDTTCQGFFIPKDTVVMISLYSIFMDEDLWGDPEVFRPERFIKEDGTINRGLTDNVTSFSLGRRRCVGEALAKMELFLFFTTLMQKVQICKPPGVKKMNFKSAYNLSHDLLPFEICVKQRV